MSHYDQAQLDIERSVDAAEHTQAGDAEANLLARAQVHATLALAEATLAAIPGRYAECARCGDPQYVHTRGCTASGCHCPRFEAVEGGWPVGRQTPCTDCGHARRVHTASGCTSGSAHLPCDCGGFE